MNRWSLACIVLVAAVTGGCTSIDRIYTEDVAAKQRANSDAVGATSESGSGTVGPEYWKY